MGCCKYSWRFLMKNKIFYLSVCLSVVVIIVFLDQLTKLLIVNNLELLENIKIIPNFFHLEYIKNYGAAWGLFVVYKFIILGVPALAIILFVYLIYFSNFKEKAISSIDLVLMLAGTIGNYIDKVRLGYVVDFLNFRFGSYHYPNFNVADMALVVGAILLAVEILIIDT